MPKVELDEKDFTALIVGLDWTTDHQLVKECIDAMADEKLKFEIVKIVSKSKISIYQN